MSEPEDPIFGEVIHSYSRQQAIEDGILVNVSAVAPDLVANAGIKFPVALTTEVWQEYVEVPEGIVGQDWKGRLWDVLFMFRTAAKNFSGDTLLFQLYVQNDPRRRAQRVTLKAVCGPGDTPDPCLTIMLPGQE